MKFSVAVTRDNRGSVLMEYAILTMMAAIPMYLVWCGCSVPLDWFGGTPIEYPGIYDFTTGQYKGTGLELQKFFEMVQSGIALPIP
ncbi:MAG: hypothetical protein J6X55_00695 [Victivallales bacterium]|nr:hypothetical protein [Victivallales bacterium]